MPLSSRPGAAAGRSNPMPEARGGGREEQPHVQRAVDAQAVAKNAPSTPPAPFPSLLLLRLLLAGAGVLFGVVFVCSAKLHGFQDLSSSTRDHTQASAVKAQSPNHWTTREFPP